MLQRLKTSLAFRLKLAQFGVFYGRSQSLNIQSLRIAGRRVALSFPPGETAVLRHELGKILIQDCYRLGRLPFPVRTVLDVGANVGIFSMAARHFFPNAVIHAYEPNRQLESHLRAHCEPLDVECHLSGLGLHSGQATLFFQENSLHSTLLPATHGEIALTAFRDAVDQMGSAVDLLKLDCEGGEWALLEDVQTWRRVRQLTMEYHLWAKPNSTTEGLTNRLRELGLECTNLEPSADGTFGLLQAMRK